MSNPNWNKDSNAGRNSKGGVKGNWSDRGTISIPNAGAKEKEKAVSVAVGTVKGTTQGISVGKRDSKIDVSRRAGSGELAYLRGDKGIGSSGNFIPMGGAAGLRKGYAEGGVLVGERGPEMIQPTTGFNVVPNDELGGKPVNAHFTIHAIDAAGVEEVLLGQQGNIISMIRSAANDNGEEFLESVNTDHIAAPKSAGGVDY